MKHGRIGEAAALTSLLTLGAQAATTYTYTGVDFSAVFAPPYTTSDHISGSFVVDAPLAANLPFTAVTPTAFAFSDGVYTVTNSTLDATSDFAVATDALGNISAWTVSISGTVSVRLGGSTLTDDLLTTNVPAGKTLDFAGLTPPGDGGSPSALNNVQSGTWTMTNVPEPTTGGFLLGIAGFSLFGRCAAGMARGRAKSAPSID